MNERYSGGPIQDTERPFRIFRSPPECARNRAYAGFAEIFRGRGPEWWAIYRFLQIPYFAP